MSPLQKSRRNGLIEILRLLFCIIIVCHHSYMLNSDPSLYSIFRGGYIFTDFFFLLSGYLMASSGGYNQTQGYYDIGKETACFLWRKIKAFYPAFLFAFCFSFVIAHFGADMTAFSLADDALHSIWEVLLIQMGGINNESIYIGQSWYLSAMLLAMLVLYPLLRLNRGIFTYILAPLVVIVIWGAYYQRFGNIGDVTTWIGFTNFGVLRAAAGISLGSISYCLSINLQTNLKDRGKLLQFVMTFLELSGYGLCVFVSWRYSGTSRDFIMIAVMALCLALTFSGITWTNMLTAGKLVSWLGGLSLYLYLNHLTVLHAINYFNIATVMGMRDNYQFKMFVYLLLSLVVSIIIKVIVDLIIRYFSQRKSTARVNMFPVD